MPRSPRSTSVWLSLLVCLLLGVTACHFDFSIASGGDDATTSSAGAGATASAEPPAEAKGTGDQGASEARAAGFESIGDDASMRVYYQFIDAKGGVRFVERLEDVPAEWRDRVGFVAMDSPPPMRPEDARRTWSADLSKVSVADARRAGPREVVLYYADWCGYCKLAKNHLDREGIDYELRNVDRPAVGLELLEKTGSKSIPVLEVDGRVLRGYSRQQYAAILGTA